MLEVLWPFQAIAIGSPQEMTLTHAEPRLKPLGDMFQASVAETSTHKRSQSYSGYIPYYLQAPQDDRGDGEHGGRFTSPRDAVTTSMGGGTGCAPQCWPDTDDSDTERYVWTQRNQGNFTAVAPPVWRLPLPSALTVNRVHSDNHLRYMPYNLRLPAAWADYMREPSVQAEGIVSYVRQFVSAGSSDRKL